VLWKKSNESKLRNNWDIMTGISGELVENKIDIAYSEGIEKLENIELYLNEKLSSIDGSNDHNKSFSTDVDWSKK
jgi:hypothetical protein